LINDWEERAHAARYCVKELARQCDVPVRTLRRFLCKQFSLCPKEWMRGMRMQRAAKLLADGRRVSETAEQLGYGSRCHFARDFKAHFGYPPSKRLRQQLEI
jgi:AraC-like DNA-binding protein